MLSVIVISGQVQPLPPYSKTLPRKGLTLRTRDQRSQDICIQDIVTFGCGVQLQEHRFYHARQSLLAAVVGGKSNETTFAEILK